MSRYKCWQCNSEHGTDNVEAVCVQCVSSLKNELATEVERLRKIEAAAISHQCPNDGSTDAVCYPPYKCPLRAALGKP